MLSEIESEFMSIVYRVLKECEKARKKHGPFHSTHEAYAVIKEELEEWWDTVKADEPDDDELVSVAAMAITAIVELQGKNLSEHYVLDGSKKTNEAEHSTDS